MTEKFAAILNLYHFLGKFSRPQIDDIILIFPRKQGFDISCKLSPMKTICMKCQNLFSGKNKINISICCLLKIVLNLVIFFLLSASVCDNFFSVHVVCCWDSWICVCRGGKSAVTGFSFTPNIENWPLSCLLGLLHFRESQQNYIP